MGAIRIDDSRVVRRLGSNKTHVAKVEIAFKGKVFGASYLDPGAVTAACGVKIHDGVIMRPGTKTKCRTCVYLTGVTEQSPNDDYSYKEAQ